MARVEEFQISRDVTLGVVEGFDRIIFKGYLTSMFPDGSFGCYLYKRGVLLKDAGKFFERALV